MKKIGWHLLLFSAIYLAVHFMQNNALGPEILRYYLKDILLVPMLLFSVAVLSGIFHLKIAIDTKEVIIAFVYCVIAFEILIPQLSVNKKGDLLDVIFYALGALGYLAFYKHSILKYQFQSLTNKS